MVKKAEELRMPMVQDALSRDTGELAVINKGHGSLIRGEVAAFIFCKRTDVVQFLES